MEYKAGEGVRISQKSGPGNRAISDVHLIPCLEVELDSIPNY